MKSKSLKVTKEDLFEILKEWDKYTFVLFKELAKEMPTSFEMDSYQRQYIVAPFAKEISLSDLSELLWKSLKEGKIAVDTIHDECFVDTQVDYFKSSFPNPETIVSNIDYLAERFHFYYLDEISDAPMKLFVKLGKLAQLRLIEEGFLEVAVSNFAKAKQIIEKREYELEIERQRLLAENRIISKVKKEIRELDKEQCVFCGRDYKYHSFDYLKIDDGDFLIDNVFLSCNGCLSKRKKQNLEPKFGRYLNK